MEHDNLDQLKDFINTWKDYSPQVVTIEAGAASVYMV